MDEPPYLLMNGITHIVFVQWEIYNFVDNIFPRRRNLRDFLTLKKKGNRKFRENEENYVKRIIEKGRKTENRGHIYVSYHSKFYNKDHTPFHHHPYLSYRYTPHYHPRLLVLYNHHKLLYYNNYLVNGQTLTQKKSKKELQLDWVMQIPHSTKTQN